MPLISIEAPRASRARSRRSAAPAVLLVAVLACWCAPSFADDSAAEQSFQEGRELLVAGRFAEACAKLEQSQRLEARLGTKLNLAFCQERLGRLATAQRSFEEAASWAQREGDAERERFARARAEALAPRVPTLQVRRAASDPVTGDTAAGDAAARPALLLDGSPLAASGEPRPLDPGEHVLVALHGGEEYWRTTVTLREAERAAITVPPPPAASLGGASAGGAVRSAEAAHGVERLVFEIGAFIAYMNIEPDESEPVGSPSEIEVGVEGQSVSCADTRCVYLSPTSTTGFVVGVSGFVGYALTEDTDLGLRFLLGPRAGDGGLVALGPAMSFVIAERYELRPGVLFGTASYAGRGYVDFPEQSRAIQVEARLKASLGFAIGLGAELGWTLTENPTGSVVLQATPLFLYGPNGLAWALPVGATFRWN